VMFVSVMFVGIIAVDVGLTLSTGTAASSAVTQRIDFSPDAGGAVGWMERVSRRLDVLGREAFGRYTPLAELFIYGLVAPLLIAGPIKAQVQSSFRRFFRSLVGSASTF